MEREHLFPKDFNQKGPGKAPIGLSWVTGSSRSQSWCQESTRECVLRTGQMWVVEDSARDSPLKPLRLRVLKRQRLNCPFLLSDLGSTVAFCPPRFWPSAFSSYHLRQVRLLAHHSFHRDGLAQNRAMLRRSRLGELSGSGFLVPKPQFFSPKVGMSRLGEFKAGRAEEYCVWVC